MSIQLRDGLANQSVDHVIEDLIVRFVANVPNEDLSSLERVFFQVEEAQWFYTDFVRQLNPYLPGMKMKLFASAVVEKCPLIWKWGDPTDALSRFGKYKSTIPVRGVALFNKELTKVVLLKGTESNTWSFPRGKISKDESDMDCAVREAEEETGFNASGLINEQDVVERTIRGKNYKIYLIKNVPEDFNFQPLVRNEISKIEWHDLKTVVKKAKSNPNFYFIVSTVLKPMMRWVNKNKGTLNDDEQLYRAEVMLKNYLGIKEQSLPQDNNDAGRELLNLLQKVTPAEENNGDNTSKDYVQMHVPQHLQNQIPMFYGQQFQHGLQAPAFPPAYGMPFSQQFMPPPQPSSSMPVPGAFPPNYLTPTMPNQQMFSPPPFHAHASPELHADPLAQQPNPQNLKKPLVVTNRLVEANPKELLSILHSKKLSLEPSTKNNLEATNIESNRSKAQLLMSVLGKKDKPSSPREETVRSPQQDQPAVAQRANNSASLLDMLKPPAPKNEASKTLLGMLNKKPTTPNSPLQDSTEFSAPHYQATGTYPSARPSNELEASLIHGNAGALNPHESGRKVTLLRRPENSDKKESLEILSILNKPKPAQRTEQVVRTEPLPQKERKYSSSSKGLLDLLKGGPAPVRREPQTTSPSQELMGLLKKEPIQSPAPQVNHSSAPTSESFENFENFEDFAGGDHHNEIRLPNTYNFDIASDDEDYDDAPENYTTTLQEETQPNFFSNQEQKTNKIRILRPGEKLDEFISLPAQQSTKNAHGQSLLGLLNGGNAQKRESTTQDGYHSIYGI